MVNAERCGDVVKVLTCGELVEDELAVNNRYAFTYSLTLSHKVILYQDQGRL